MPESDEVARRKTDHLQLAVHGPVAFTKTTTLLECVTLLHDSLPELSLDEVRLQRRWLGKTLQAPLLIAAMTGGTARAAEINLALAEVAERRGYALGVGSQRAMLEAPELAETFRVRSVAPTALVLGNIGGVQAARAELGRLQQLVGSIGADALCVHLNPAQEVAQPGGDRDFRGILDRIALLVGELGVPVVVKETGCGISPSVARRLRAAGVEHVDVSGAGGTSWVAVEAERASGDQRALGERFREWGIPTAASVVYCAAQGFGSVVASGGLATGLDAAKALALGADIVGAARGVLQALELRGVAGVDRHFDQFEAELRAAMLLTGCRQVSDLRSVGRVLQEPLPRWLAAANPATGV